MKKMTLAVSALCAALLLSGCATTKFKDSWKNPEMSHKIRRVYLIAVTRNDKIRKSFEEEFVRQLAVYGVTGIPSYPDLVISGDMDREAIRKRLVAQGTDSALVIRLAGREQKTALYSGSESGYAASGYNGYYDQFGMYNPQYAYRYYDKYYNGSVAIISSNPVVEHQFQEITLSANLYDTETAEVLWSALTETAVGDDNRAQRLREFVETVVKKLLADGLL